MDELYFLVFKQQCEKVVLAFQLNFRSIVRMSILITKINYNIMVKEILVQGGRPTIKLSNSVNKVNASIYNI